MDGDMIIRDLVAARLLAQVSGQVAFSQRWLQAYLGGDAAALPDRSPLRQAWGMKAVIGLTGNIAMGKSTVLRELEALGAAVLDADRLVHQLRQPGLPGYHAVVELLGQGILLADGRIDSAALAAQAFASPALLAKLERIFRPLVVDAVAGWARSATNPVLVIEAIKLLEGDLMRSVDEVWVVDAPRAEQLRRLVAERGLSVEEAQRRIDAQNPQSEKLAAADVVIHNGGSLTAMRWQALTGWGELLERLAVAGWPLDELVSLFIARCLNAAQATTSAEQAEQALREIASLVSGESRIEMGMLRRHLNAD